MQRKKIYREVLVRTNFHCMDRIEYIYIITEALSKISCFLYPTEEGKSYRSGMTRGCVNEELGAKASKCRVKFSSKISIFLRPYVYVQLFHFNCNELNLFIAIKVKLLNLHIGAYP